ncbi:MAG: metalloregulator ArsR/SmtB family transcription factor [Candidatus Dormibacteraeota bacterium]|nr:metalloregulator ArsR/SmtB family transcription factor [Candidatus Dormibacteraeota bacterium]
MPERTGGPSDLEHALHEQFARVAKALASPARVALVDVLCQGERSVEALSLAAGLGMKNTSAQLRELRLVGLVEARREGTRVYYRVAEEAVCVFLGQLRHLARRRLAEVDRLVRDHLELSGDLEPVRRVQLLERVARGEVVVFDVRPREEYKAGHIPGARSVPLEELDSCLAGPLGDVEIVAYCRGPYCVLAPQAVSACRARGLRARRLEDGFPEWRLAGLPVALGAEEAA